MEIMDVQTINSFKILTGQQRCEGWCWSSFLFTSHFLGGKQTASYKTKIQSSWWYFIVFTPLIIISIISKNWRCLWLYSAQRIQQKALLYLKEIYQLHSNMLFNVCNRAASERLHCLDYLLEYSPNGPD